VDAGLLTRKCARRKLSSRRSSDKKSSRRKKRRKEERKRENLNCPDQVVGLLIEPARKGTITKI
jgi:phage terminase small subunit